MFEIIKKFGLHQKKTLLPMLVFSVLSTIFLSILPFILVLIFDLIKNFYLGELQPSNNVDTVSFSLGLEGIFLYFKKIFQFTISNYSILSQLIILVSIFLLFSLISSLLRFLSITIIEYREIETRFHIRKNLRTKILEHDLLDFGKKQLGYYQSMFIKDVEDLSIVSGSYINSFFQHSVQFLICIYFLFSTNIFLTMALIFIFLLHLLYNRILNAPILKNTKAEYEVSGELSGKIIDYLNNFKTVKILTGQNQNIQKVLDNNFADLKKKEFFIRVLGAIQNPARAFINDLAIILVISFVVFFLFKKEISIEVAFLFIFFSKFASQPISGLSTTLLWGKTVISAYSRLEKIFNYKSKIISGKITKDKFTDNIEFRKISFDFGQNKILKDVSFRIKKNSHNLIVGKNGSGKSTLLNLLTRMFDPNTGEILMDNENIKNFNIESYQKLFSFISQDNYLIDTTIYENLIVGTNLKKNDQKNIDNLIKEALAKVGGLFVYDLPLKLNTRVGERAKFLSGGEKQKICIARAILQKSEIMIFDETSSGLDKNSRSKFNTMLESLKKSYTIIEVDHTKSLLHGQDINVINL
jgi:ABC-type multidrug transport system fused ATPase/permease subunit